MPLADLLWLFIFSFNICFYQQNSGLVLFYMLCATMSRAAMKSYAMEYFYGAKYVRK